MELVSVVFFKFYLQFINFVDVVVDQVIAFVLILGDSWVSQLDSFSSLFTTWVSSPAWRGLASSLSAAVARSWVSSAALQPSDPDPPHFYHQGQL